MNSESSVLNLLAPLSGPVVPIESVPDPVFAQKTVGPGIAVDPTTEVLLSPCSGRISQLHRAGHAVTVDANGTQVLLHIGLDTVKLNGEGFHPKVKVGDLVRAGQPLIEFDADLVAQKAKSLITLMILTEVPEERLHFPPLSHAEAGSDILVNVEGGGTTLVKSEAAADGAQSSEILIELRTGLHARPAALLAGIAKAYQADVSLHTKGRSADAKSVVGIMGLEIGHGDRVHFRAHGSDARMAVAGLERFLRELEEKPEPAHAADVSREKRRTNDKNVLTGVGVSPGVAIGRVHQVRVEQIRIEENTSRTPEQEIESLTEALANAAADLRELSEQVKANTDSNRAAIFTAHQELLTDPGLVVEARRLIASGKSAAYAWDRSVSTSADRLAALKNELMANRANDLRDVGRRVLSLLTGAQTSRAPSFPDDAVLIAENLTPSETVQLDRSKVLAFCTTAGGATSHVAILARSLGLPAIAGIDPRALELGEGSEVILDGEHGELYLNPEREEKSAAEQLQREQLERRRAAIAQAHRPAATKDGRQIEVAANIGSVADAKQAVSMGADGVGLLRSEFLFLERETPPTEDEQYLVYQEISDVLGNRRLVIRTLDVGGDKPLKYLPIEAEENPFLGVRGIRVGFMHPEILRQQLRAILRVRHKGTLGVMFPMVAGIEEFRKAKVILEEERGRLAAPPIEVGVMVEVPAVALTADTFAKEVDFFSIGTNDLTQYTLAMDRGHSGLAKQVDALHPSVLKMIQLSVDAAHAHGKWVGVCGGLASDLKAVPFLLGLGVDELSVSVPSVPLVKSVVRETEMPKAEQLAGRAVNAENAAGVRALEQ